jgi:hypothetical protein
MNKIQEVKKAFWLFGHWTLEILPAVARCLGFEIWNLGFMTGLVLVRLLITFPFYSHLQRILHESLR